MTYITKTVSSSSIIAKVYRTLRPSDSSWIVGAIEDIGWAIQAIGYHTGFVDKTTQHDERLLVKGHRVKIPCVAERIKMVEIFLDSMKSKTVYLNADGTVRKMPEEEYNKRKTTRLHLGADLSGYGLSAESPRTTHTSPSTPYYQLNGDYIITSYEECELKLHYKAFNVDDEGLPLIIDDFDYKTCVYWYVIKEALLSGDYANASVNYKTAFEMFEMYLPRAQNAGKMPSIDGMARFAAGWTRMNLGHAVDNEYFMGMEQKLNF